MGYPMTIPFTISPYVSHSYVHTLLSVFLYYSESRSTKEYKIYSYAGRASPLGYSGLGSALAPFYLRMERLLPTHPGVQRLVFLLLSHVD